MRVAIVHDWLVTYAGSEKVLEQILHLFPEGDLFSLVDFLPESERGFIRNKRARTSFIQKLPFARGKFRLYLPVMPFAIEGFDLTGYDLIISNSHAVAKGVISGPHQPHVCYCHTPMRYAWNLQQQYLEASGLDRGLIGVIARAILRSIRKWDASTAGRVDYYMANSQCVADRIHKCYGKTATVIYPPVDTGAFDLRPVKEDYYVTVSRMVPYKKVDLIVETFSAMPDKTLVVIGDGPDFKKVRSKAGRNVQLLGHQPFAVLKDHVQKAKAFVYAAEEDFGIAMVEAQACGTPVIAFGRGGSLETIVGLQNTDAGGQRTDKEPTGVFFYEQTTEALKNAIRDFEKNQEKFDGQQIREHVIRFSVERFKREFKEFVDRKTAGML